MGDIHFASTVGISIPSLGGQSDPYEGLNEAIKKNQVSRVFESSAKPVVLPLSVSRRSEISVEKTEEAIYRVESVIEAGLDSDEEFAETPDPEEQEEKEDLPESSPDNKPAMEAGDFSEEEEKQESEEEKAAEKVRRKESKALQKAKAILLQNS